MGRSSRKPSWFHSTAAGLGVRLVLVLGVRPGIDDMVRESGHEPVFSRGQRVTDGVAMEAAMQAAGAARMEVEARLSKVSCARADAHLRSQRGQAPALLYILSLHLASVLACTCTDPGHSSAAEVHSCGTERRHIRRSIASARPVTLRPGASRAQHGA